MTAKNLNFAPNNNTCACFKYAQSYTATGICLTCGLPNAEVQQELSDFERRNGPPPLIPPTPDTPASDSPHE